MSIAVFGCVHGKIDVVNEYCRAHKSSFAICCGDFQSTRHEADLASMDAPKKYRELCDFPKYYEGKRRLSCPLLFVGGNHEASQYLSGMSNGGWVGPRMYYMGTSGVVRVGGLRVAGISGVYQARDYREPDKPTYEWNRESRARACHMRAYDVHRLLKITEPVDVFVSHDWPCNVFDMVHNKQAVLDFFKENPEVEAERETFGSLPLRTLLAKLQPRYWVCAHMHRRWEADIVHQDTGKVTHFIALGKVNGREDDEESYYATELPRVGAPTLKFDVEWVNIVRQTWDRRKDVSLHLYTRRMSDDDRKRIVATLKKWEFTAVPEYPDKGSVLQVVFRLGQDVMSGKEEGGKEGEKEKEEEEKEKKLGDEKETGEEILSKGVSTGKASEDDYSEETSGEETCEEE